MSERPADRIARYYAIPTIELLIGFQWLPGKLAGIVEESPQGETKFIYEELKLLLNLPKLTARKIAPLQRAGILLSDDEPVGIQITVEEPVILDPLLELVHPSDSVADHNLFASKWRAIKTDPISIKGMGFGIVVTGLFFGWIPSRSAR